jgi:hypothetical protein
MKRKIIAIALILALIVNLVLFAFRVTNTLIFWAVIIAAAMYTYLVFNKRSDKKK